MVLLAYRQKKLFTLYIEAILMPRTVQAAPARTLAVTMAGG